MAKEPKVDAGARLEINLTATGWAACTAIWFLVMGAIAICAGDRLLGIIALLVLLFGGAYVLTLLAQGR